MPNQLCIVESAPERFLPLTYFRPVYDLRCGIQTLREKITRAYAQDAYLFCRPYLAATIRPFTPFAATNEWPRGDCLILNGRLIAHHGITRKIPLDQREDVVFVNHNDVVAVRASEKLIARLSDLEPHENPLDMFDDLPHVLVDVETVQYPWDLIARNGHEIERDCFELHGDTFGVEHAGRVQAGAYLEWPDRITIEKGAVIKPGAVLDAEKGRIFIAHDAVIMAGAAIEGPAYVGPHSLVKVHAQIYGNTTIGPVCKIGGEVEACIIHAYSNKQHQGFLGHSYIGEWTNIGAGSNNSDLKNNYGRVRMQIGHEMVDTGLTLMGMLMGDHSKCAIGTTFNTGTVVGPCCNIFGHGLPPKYVPAFSWGGSDGFATYDIDRCVDVARRVMARRKVEFKQTDEAVMRTVFQITEAERHELVTV